MNQYKVVQILNDDYKIVINAGDNKGIKKGQRFLVYALSDHEIFDPDTQKSLGFLEIVKGTGKVIHVQEKMATIESDVYETSQPTKIIRKNPMYGFGSTEEETVSREHIAFDNPRIGDFVKQI
jgi:hypothetical protein